jgi:N4-(beta-N-acetylglucosaminyl)-L-asparaginase
MTRRDLFLSSAAMAYAAQAQQRTSGKMISISSANGLRATARAMEMMKDGKDTLDAVIAGVNILELDPEETSVGFGGLPNEEGVTELDASVMHGPSRRCAGVAAVHGCRTPSKLAKIVMEQTDHVMMVGAGADKFAVEMGLPAETLSTEKSRLAFVVWKQALRDRSGHSNWGPGLDSGPPKSPPLAELKKIFPHADDETLAWAWGQALNPTHGTINCLALNAKGEMSGVTTTSGQAFKIPGRVGDSPIIGAGLYVDQDVGAAGSTGRGEENIRISGAHTIVENMRHGMPPKEAGLDALKRIARNFNNDKQWMASLDINFYVLRNDGAYAGVCMWKGRTKNLEFAVNDGGASRLEQCSHLLEN